MRTGGACINKTRGVLVSSSCWCCQLAIFKWGLLLLMSEISLTQHVHDGLEHSVHRLIPASDQTGAQCRAVDRLPLRQLERRPWWRGSWKAGCCLLRYAKHLPLRA